MMPRTATRSRRSPKPKEPERLVCKLIISDEGFSFGVTPSLKRYVSEMYTKAWFGQSMQDGRHAWGLDLQFGDSIEGNGRYVIKRAALNKALGRDWREQIWDRIAMPFALVLLPRLDEFYRTKKTGLAAVGVVIRDEITGEVWKSWEQPVQENDDDDE